jgi:hypothetical protein
MSDNGKDWRDIPFDQAVTLGKHGGKRVKGQVRNTRLKGDGSVERTLARLRRDRPDLAEKVRAGKLSANAAAVGAEKDIFLTINGTWFSRLAIFSKPVGRAIQAFRAIVRRRRRVRVIAKGFTRRELEVESGVVTEQELEAFIRFASETLPERTDSGEDARAVLIAEKIITADGELAAQYRSAGHSASYRTSRRAQQAGPADAERLGDGRGAWLDRRHQLSAGARDGGSS